MSGVRSPGGSCETVDARHGDAATETSSVSFQSSTHLVETSLSSTGSDRLGKSIRTFARDALIADSTEPQYHGMAFGRP